MVAPLRLTESAQLLIARPEMEWSRATAAQREAKVVETVSVLHAQSHDTSHVEKAIDQLLAEFARSATERHFLQFAESLIDYPLTELRQRYRRGNRRWPRSRLVTRYHGLR